MNNIIPQGRYKCKIVSANTDNRQFINIKLIIVNGEYENKAVYYRIYSNGKTGAYNSRQLSELARACNIADKTHFDTLEAYLSAIENHIVIAIISHRHGTGQYYGKVFVNVEGIRADESCNS